MGDFFGYGGDDGQGAAVSVQTGGSQNINTLLQQKYATGGGGALTPVTFLIGLIGLLVVMKLLGESNKTSIQPAHLHIGPYNILTVTVTAIVGIVLAKIAFNAFQIPGITDLVNAA